MNLNIALVGCDTSHSVHFARLLNDDSDPEHVPGACVIAAVTDGYGTISGSRDRALANAAEIESKHGVTLHESIADLPPGCDAIFIETTDGARHLDQLLEAVEFKIPIFIDKPLALGSEDAESIFRIGREKNVPIMSSSALRYDTSFCDALEQCLDEPIQGADIYGPMTFVAGCPEYFWYGIHTAEMLLAAMGPGLNEVRVIHQERHDVISGVWDDGRIGTIRGTREPHFAFGGTLHTANKPVGFTVAEGGVPFYAKLLQQVVRFVKTGTSPIPHQQTLDIIRFLEAAEKQRKLEHFFNPTPDMSAAMK